MDALTAAKLMLHIDSTVTDDDTIARLDMLIDHGKAYLNQLTGAELDYEQSQYQALLLSYVRYAYNDAAEYFLENFADDILRVQLDVGSTALKGETADAQQTGSNQ